MTEAEEQVRRLLADVRHTEPIPEDVATRLDHRLAELYLPPVDDELAAVRRRRAAALLVAAVGIIAVGIGVGSILQPDPVDVATTAQDSGEESGAESAEGSDEESDVTGAEPDDSLGAPSAREGDGAGQVPQGGDPETLTGPAADFRLTQLQIVQTPAALHSHHLGDDVRVVIEDVRLSGGATVRDPLSVLASYGCEPTDFGVGTFVAATYDGQPAVLALRPPEGDNQVVDVVACGTGDLLHTLTVPAE